MKKFSAISRVLAFLLVVCLCSAYVPVMTFAADVTPGTITITPTEGEPVTLEEGKAEATIGEGSATYDVANNKVTLNALNVVKIVFAMNGDFTVEVIGENNVTNAEGTAVEVTSGNVTVTGGGTLNITSSVDHAFKITGNITINGVSLNTYANSTGTTNTGLYCTKNVLIDGAQTNVMVYSFGDRALNAQTVIINDGTVKNYYIDENDAEVISKYGITATVYGMTINGGSVTAKVKNNSALYSVKNGLAINGGTVKVEAPGTSLIVDSGDLKISGENTTVTVLAKTAAYGTHVKAGNLEVTSGATLTSETAGSGRAIQIVGNITLDGATVTATAKADVAIESSGTDAEVLVKNSTVTATAANNTFNVTNGNITIENSRISATSLSGQVAIRAIKNLTINNSYVTASSTGNTIRADAVLTISGDKYDAETGEGTYIYSYGKDYALWYGTGANINGGTIVAEGEPIDASYGVIGGTGGYTQNGGDVTVTVKTGNNNRAFDIRNSNFTLNGGSLDVNTNAGAAFYFRAANTGIVLNGGRFTGSAGALIAQANAANVNTITVSPYADIDVTFTSGAAFISDIITVNAKGVTWEEGKELSATSGAAKTVPVTTVDIPLSATVTLNGKAQADQTVELYDGETLLGTAVSDADGKVTFAAVGLPVGNTYTLTLKQVSTNGDGYVYDLEGKTVSVVVKEDGTYTVTGEPAFENIYKFITVVTDDKTVTFGDTEGDDAATTIKIGDGTVSYNADNGKLILNNVTATSIVVDVRKDIVLEVVGENNVINNEGNRVFRVYNGSVTVTGEGTLNVSSKEFSINIDNGSWIQNGATVDSKATTGHTFLWTNGDFVFNGGTLTGKGYTYYGIYASQNVTITGGTIDVEAAANVINAQNGDFLISGGTVTVETVTDNSSYGDYALRANAKDLTITGGTVIAKAIATALGDGSAVLTIGPNVKLIATSQNDKVSNAKSIVVNGARFVTGLSDFAGTKVETLVEGEKDYNLPGEGTIIVNVTLNGENDNGREVQLLQNGEVVEIATVTDGKVFFKINPVGEGEHTYTVKVVGENGNGYTFAEEQTVTVTVNNEGLATSEPVVLANTYEAEPADVTFEANVTLTGRDMIDGEFVLLIGEDEVPVEGGKLTWTSMFTAEGTYTVTVAQKDTGLSGVTYDLTEKTITVTVTDNGEGQLIASVEGNGVTFANTYAAAPTTIDIDLKVELTGKTMKECDFSFVLMQGEDVVANATNDAEGNIVFKNIEFVEAGQFPFTVKQIVGDAAGVTYDETVADLLVYVEDWGEGELDVCGIDGAGKVFKNTYDYIVDTDVIVNVKVFVSDITLKEGDIVANLLKGEENIATGMIDANGNVVFTIEADKAMGGTYTVSLSTEIKGITLPEAQTLTVEVKDNGDGTATVTATNTDLTFHGSYRVPFAAGKIENGKYIVDETGKATEMGLIKIGNDYYYAGPNGVLVTNQKYYAWRLNENCDIEKGWYYFDADGKLVDTGIVDGVYYENGKPTEKGLIKIGEDYYYAGPNGKLVSDQRYYAWKADENCDLPTAWYWFDETGKMIGSSAEGEIVEINGVKYFYRSGKPTEMGLFEYEGDLYVAQYDGKIITSENYTKYGPGKYYVWKADGVKLDKGYWRYFDAEGKMIGASSEGEIVTINGVKYYYVNGAPKEMGLFEYEGNYYVAQYDGKIITDKKYYVWKVDSSASEIGTGWFNFDADGKMIKS